MATGFVFEELYLWHDTQNWPNWSQPGLTLQPGACVENPETKRRIKNLLDVSGLADQLTRIRAAPADEETLRLVHTQEHIERIRTLSDGFGGDAGDAAIVGGGSFEIAQLAVGGAIAAVEAVIAGAVDNAYALVRPPGHHAEADRAMGFCLFNNIAIAVTKALADARVARVAVVDWDVHHGNGVEAAFYEDPRVLTISIHQEELYPLGGGGVDARGDGDGAGYAINAPLPPGSGDGAYLAAMERLVAPALARFQPEIIIVACGFDAAALDPLGRMMVTSDGFRRMTDMMRASAEKHCAGRLVLVHEGGYSANYAPYCGLAVIEALSGVATGVADPWLEEMLRYGGQALQPHQDAAIARACAAHGVN